MSVSERATHPLPTTSGTSGNIPMERPRCSLLSSVRAARTCAAGLGDREPDTNSLRLRYVRASHSIHNRPRLQVSPFETAFQAAAVHFWLRHGFCGSARMGLIIPVPTCIPPIRLHPRPTSVVSEPKSHLISSGTAESPCGRQSPAPQVTLVPRGPRRGRTALKHCLGPFPMFLVAMVPLPSEQRAPAFGGFSLRLPRFPKRPDLGCSAVFPLAF